MKVESYVPGVVTMFHAEPGARVEKDQPVVTLECMKMLYEINAPCGGTVKFLCEIGDVVGQGEAVAEIFS